MLTQEIILPYLPAKRIAKPYVMGIDPDCDKSGVAIWSRLTDAYSVLNTLDFAQLMQQINYYSPHELLIVVEAGHINKSNWHLPAKCSKQQAAEIGRRVGMNASTGLMIQHFCRANGFEVEEYQPNTPKWKADYFKMVTGLKSGHNQEIRDAVRCIHGR